MMFSFFVDRNEVSGNPGHASTNITGF